MLNRFSPILGLGIVVVAVAVPSSQQAQHKATTDVGAMFDRSCSSCHVRPDPQFKTDKAWINRIAGTT